MKDRRRTASRSLRPGQLALLLLIGCGGSQSSQESALSAPEAASAEEEPSDLSALEITATDVEGLPPPSDLDNGAVDDEARGPEVTPEGEEASDDDPEAPQPLIITALAGASPPPPARVDRSARLSLKAPPSPQTTKRRVERERAREEARAASGSSRGSGSMAKRGLPARRPPPRPSTSVSPTPSAPPPASPGPSTARPRSGAPDAPAGHRSPVGLLQVQSRQVLTAATVPDSDRRPEHLEYLARHPGEAASLGLDLTRRVRFRVVDGQSRPIHDASLTLIGNGLRVAGRTHADGLWDFFPSLTAPQAAGEMTLYIQTGGATAQAAVPIPPQGDGRDIIIRLPSAQASSPAALDLAFLIDVTGSMSDELRYVNEEVIGIVDRVRGAVPNTRVRVAATFYRDRGDLVPLSQIPFSTNLQTFVGHMRLVEAGGGGDYPEDLNLGLAAALTTLEWSQTPAVRVLVVIADAPPQRYADFRFSYLDAMADASTRGIRILPVAASGADRVVEFLFRAMGASTGAPYVYLTDDSGVGDSHMEADTDRVAVEMFSDLLTRLLISDLLGRGMHEPDWVSQPLLVPSS